MFHKLLHFTTEIRPGGGPPGYLYNLKKIEKNYNYHVFSVNENMSRDNTSYNKIKFPKLILRHLLCLKYLISLLGIKKIKEEKKIFDYDFVLAHTAPIAARLISINKNEGKKTKIGFMPHGPVSYSIEVLDDIESKYGKFITRRIYEKALSHFENQIFNRADFISVAAKKGLDAYTNIKCDYKNKLFEVTTGLPELKCDLNQNEIRNELNIPPNSFVVGFFGRYNHHKGYDFFCNEILLNKSHENIFFISAGTGPISEIKNNNYINFGWRRDIEKLITACDLVVLPNRYTYFDLLPLECLSLSRPVAVSKTGGNIKLLSLSSAIIGFDMKEGNLIETINRLASKNKEELNILNRSARKSFERNFNEIAFSNNHEALFSNIKKYFKNNKIHHIDKTANTE
ncbi:glycosyltransferase [Xenorhabdus bovienii]|uniref:glycosyltransferase n=1 Tax=Xenorhabdus bovienii TaxID=40576 RepID=UPI0023B33758|nr:glycosyltransferase [Xenorhabdus bovienii]MDE9486655.1 glycosyltransferase [Xenorhabdus bovienii]